MKNAFRTNYHRLSKCSGQRSLARVLLVLAASLNLFSQVRQVSGEVTAESDGSPMVGVSVIVKGTTNGTITDMNGALDIEVPDSGITLKFSFIGYEKHEKLTSGRTVINITLSESAVLLDEVVVTAYNDLTTRAIEDVTGKFGEDALPANLVLSTGFINLN